MSFVRSPSKLIGWVLAFFVVAGFPATSSIYWPAVGEAGVLPPESDTIIIPMMNSIFLAVVLLPLVCVITWLCLRGKDDAGNLLAWDTARPILSALVTLCFAVPFCFGLWSLVGEFTAPRGWHGLWWLPYTLVTLLWLAMVRGSALSKRNAANHPFPPFPATPAQWQLTTQKQTLDTSLQERQPSGSAEGAPNDRN